MKITRIAIVGMGALGMLYGEQLARAYGRENVRFVMDGERLARHRADVYTVNGEAQDFYLQDAASAEPADLVIVATKFSGLAAALDEMKNLVAPSTIIFSVLNGISSEEIIRERYGGKNLLHCVALGMDAVREGTHLRYEHRGILKIGCLHAEQRPALAAVTEMLTRSGIAFSVEEDILHALWAKLLLNVGINQTCMVYETDYGGALADEAARTDMFAAMHEVIDVARSEGVTLGEEDFDACVKILRGLAPGGLPSMRQDALAQRPSEVELFAGTIIRLAAKHQLAVPVNQRYYEKILAMEKEYAR